MRLMTRVRNLTARAKVANGEERIWSAQNPRSTGIHSSDRRQQELNKPPYVEGAGVGGFCGRGESQKKLGSFPPVDFDVIQRLGSNMPLILC
eukprot:1471667-Rhodomonas_salina.1